MQPYNSKLKRPYRLLRKNMTDAEQLLWKYLRRRQICDIQFNRQKPLLNYIVDFYSPKAKLVIEIDGSQHLEKDNLIRDKQRDEALQKLGLTILRFDNKQVLKETESVLQKIYEYVIESTNQISPNPSFPKRGTK